MNHSSGSSLPPLSLTVARLLIGVVFGSILLSLFFSAWQAFSGGGPVIGALVFGGIGLLAAGLLGWQVIIKGAKAGEEMTEMHSGL